MVPHVMAVWNYTVGRYCWHTNHIIAKAVSFLAVHRTISERQHIFAHPEADSADVLDEAHDDRRPSNVPSDDEQSTNDLKPDLLTIAVDRATWVRDAERCAALGGCENAGEKPSQDAGDHMGVRDAEGIIDVMREEFELTTGNVHADPRYDTRASWRVQHL